MANDNKKLLNPKMSWCDLQIWCKTLGEIKIAAVCKSMPSMGTGMRLKS